MAIYNNPRKCEHMKIGFSLPINYLTGNASSPPDLLWTEIFPTVSSCLAYLGDHGVCSIEINKLADSTNPELIRQAVDEVIGAGHNATFHGWLPMDTTPGEMPRIFEVAGAALTAHGITDAIPVTVHGHNVVEPLSHQQAITMTASDLTNLANAYAERNSLFIPALEICRAKPGGPIGITYAEILNIAGRISNTTPLGFCWDIGHSQINHIKQGHPPFPDQAFVHRTIHTHIHDISPDGRTHGPLLNIDGYVKDCLTILRNGGYQGVYNLELYPMRWTGNTENRKEALTASIKNLRTMLDN